MLNLHTIDSSVAGVNEFFGRVFTKMAGAVALSTVVMVLSLVSRGALL